MTPGPVMFPPTPLMLPPSTPPGVAPARPSLRERGPEEFSQRLRARITNETFFLRELSRTRLASVRKRKILFSRKPAWERSIRAGFLLTPHEIVFEDFTPANLRECDVVVPLTIPGVARLNQLRHLVPGNPIPIPDLECMALCDDKYRLNRTLALAGFGGLIPRMGAALRLPYILKKKVDEFGANSHMILTAKDERRLSKAMANPDYFRQEIVRGPLEYATHILIKNHQIVCSMNFEYAFATPTPIKGKDEIIYRKICPCPYLSQFASVLTAIGFEGLCCINYKVAGDSPLILEINPRFGASLSRFFFSFMRHLD